jgi:hypothetical protein
LHFCVSSENLSLRGMKVSFRKYFFFISAIILISSCKKDENFITDSSVHLQFSEDTIMFDTVFVTTGSATQIFTVRNNSTNAVRISTVRLGGGSSSFYRLNINGIPGKIITNVEIGPKDSLFIFAEVTIPDPGNPNTPFIVNDSILFEFSDGNHQQVNLVAFGQRAHFHHASPNSGRLFFLNCNETWTNDLPHVIYGYALVDSGCTLTIEHGARVHFAPASGMIVFSTGTLKVNGTLQDSVTFQGSRLGDAFKDVPGQWDQIWLSNLTYTNLLGSNVVSPGTKNSSINYAIIKNGNIGLKVDTVFSPGLTTLQLDNSIIKNMAGVALLGQGATIKANNCVFANSGQYLAALLYGGNYRFLHCTLANYWSNGNRTTPSVLINNYYGSTIRSIDAYFGNSIVYGNIENEIGFDSASASPAGTNNYIFDHAILKVGSSFSTGSSLHYSSIIHGTDPLFLLFKNTDDNNYELESGSPAIDAGSISITNLDPLLDHDLKGDPRPAGSAPDLGAYERQ